jgi:hypothetical protein
LGSVPKGLAYEWLVFAFYVAAVAVWEFTDVEAVGQYSSDGIA